MHNSIPDDWTKTELKLNHVLYQGPGLAALKQGTEIFLIEESQVVKQETFEDGVAAHEQVHSWIWESAKSTPNP